MCRVCVCVAASQKGGCQGILKGRVGIGCTHGSTHHRLQVAPHSPWPFGAWSMFKIQARPTPTVAVSLPTKKMGYAPYLHKTARHNADSAHP